MIQRALKRLFKNDCRLVDSVYTQIRSSSNINPQILSNLAEIEISKLDEKTIANYSYILSCTYKRNSGLDSKILKFEIDVSPHIKKFNDTTFLRILENSQYLYRQAYQKFTSKFLQEIVNRLKSFKNRSNIFKAYDETSVLFKLMKESQVEYEELFIEFFQRFSEQINQLKIDEIVLILNIVARIKKNNSKIEIKTQKNEFFLNIIETELAERLKNSKLPVNISANILKNLILSFSNNEDFVKSLEEIVFSELNLLSERDFSQLFISYNERNLHDYFYIINSIYKPFYEEFINRFENFPLHILGDYLENYWQDSWKYGFYCDERIIQVFQRFLSNTQVLKNSDHFRRTKILIAMINICNHADLTHHNEICVKIYESLEKDLEGIEYKKLLLIANAFSRVKGIPLAFWEKLSKKTAEFETTETLSIQYSIYLNLSLQQPQVYEIVRPKIEPNIEKLKEAWVIKSREEITEEKISKPHSLLIKACEALKVPFEIEYFDEYFIDVAIPDLKIAYEVQGPGHFVFPNRQLNGRTQNKKINLEKLGWTYHSIPFFVTRSNEKIFQEIVKNTLPLNF